VQAVQRNKSDYGGKDLWKRWVLSLEWKVEGVTDGENEGGDCDEVYSIPTASDHSSLEFVVPWFQQVPSSNHLNQLFMSG